MKDTANFVKYPCGCYTEYVYNKADMDTQSVILYRQIKEWMKNKEKHTLPYKCYVFLCEKHREVMKGLDEWKEEAQ